jgi:DNA adenine methylase
MSAGMGFCSPLRYPGGKARLAGFFSRLIEANELEGGTYVEPFAGGAGVAMDLLVNKVIEKVIINDYDPRLVCFWKAILEHPDEFILKIKESALSVEEFKRQRAIGRDDGASILDRGFAMFYLNRTCRSGVFNGGPIGGLQQDAVDLIDARFNRKGLCDRICKIANHADKVELYGLEAKEFITQILRRLPEDTTLAYLDPPYYRKGRTLYLNHYDHSDHRRLSEKVDEIQQYWVVSYDDMPVINDFYRPYRQRRFKLDYSARIRRKGDEVMIFSDRLALPDDLVLPHQVGLKEEMAGSEAADIAPFV